MSETPKYTLKLKAGRSDMQSYDPGGEPFTNLYHATKHSGRHHVTKDPLPLVVGRTSGDDNKAHAATIVLAVNSHALLVEALKKVLVDVHGPNDECDNFCGPVCSKIREALRAAGVES